MSLRISSAAFAFLLLAGCGAQSPPPPGTTIDCRPSGQEAFGADCIAEVAVVGGERQVLLWNPDGSFHRLRATGDERWLEAADGAEQAEIEEGDATLIIGIGGDAYILQRDLVAPRPGG